MDDLTSERSLDSQATLVSDVLGLFSDILSKVFLLTGTGRRLIDCLAGIKSLYCINII